MNWGKSIALAFILFAAFIAVLVTVCVKQDVALVSATYYQEDLDFQKQFDAKKNADELSEVPQIMVENGELVIKYASFNVIEDGILFLQRPSDKNLDQKFELNQNNEGVIRLQSKDFVPGLYKVKLKWRQSNREFQLDKTIVV
jgi:hypothetical protein